MPLKILFGEKREWIRPLRNQLEQGGFSFAMASLSDVDVEAYDAVVPLTRVDRKLLQSMMDRGKRPRAILAPASSEMLCHDKLAFNERLNEAGLGSCIPPLLHEIPTDDGAYPIILKKRRDEWGRNSRIVLSRSSISAFDPDAEFLQTYVAGSEEYATHILMRAGAPAFHATVRYLMEPMPHVKGAFVKPWDRVWLDQTPFLDLFVRVLDCVGFHDGTCCIDYRLHNGTPMIFEVNPRFGASLSRKIVPYIKSYLELLAPEFADC